MSMAIRQRIANMIYPEGAAERRSLERLAETDPMTEFANRRAFDSALPRAEADPVQVIVLFDINNLGQVNKRVGHTEGDWFIKVVAEYIKVACNDLDIGERLRFRIGGDEFAVICRNSYIANQLIRFVETRFKARRCAKAAHVIVSVTGAVGKTFAEADSYLQPRKRAQKEEHLRREGFLPVFKF